MAKYRVKTAIQTTTFNVQYLRQFSMFTDHFSRTGRAVGPLCVCVFSLFVYEQ